MGFRSLAYFEKSRQGDVETMKYLFDNYAFKCHQPSTEAFVDFLSTGIHPRL
jgi:hypothetical protein